MDVLARARRVGVRLAFLGLVLGALACAGLAAGCGFSPPIGDGELACALDHSCPPDFMCASDGRCHLHPITVDAMPAADGSPHDGAVVDASIVDAAPDAFVQADARPAGTQPPTIYETSAGGGSTGTTTVTGRGRAVLIVGDDATGVSMGIGSVEWGICESVKVN